MSATTTQLLSSVEFCKLLYDTMLKVHLQTFLSIPVTQKCQILSCDTLVANERYMPSVAEQPDQWRKEPDKPMLTEVLT